MDPNNNLIDHRYFRESCIKTPTGMYTKDLRIFKNRDLKRMTLVDNAMYSFAFQIFNGVPIVPYYENQRDT